MTPTCLDCRHVNLESMPVKGTPCFECIGRTVSVKASGSNFEGIPEGKHWIIDDIERAVTGRMPRRIGKAEFDAMVTENPLTPFIKRGTLVK